MRLLSRERNTETKLDMHACAARAVGQCLVEIGRSNSAVSGLEFRPMPLMS